MRAVNTNKKAVGELLEAFSRTTEEIFSLEEFKKLLLSGKQLNMKFGIDVTAPDLHIGHAVNLWMYRKLQELGHKLIFIIGDFTTRIGDPTGRSKTRPVVSLKTIKKNAKAFIKQAMMILHNKPGLIEIRKNSEWLGKMSAEQLLSLMSLVTHERLVARDMFRERVKEGKPIYEHELVYPILQGYDSVASKSDLTIIGSDQLYNEMMGRFFQEKFGQAPQVIITTKITPGIDGKKKQSKSLGNYIGLAHSPREKFGRIMSIPDSLIFDYFKVYTEVPMPKIARMKKKISLDPMKYKLLLAKEIVKRYHGESVAEKELEWFKKTFSERQLPEDAPRVFIGKDKAAIFEILRQCFSPKEKSNSQLRRLIRDGAVKVNGRTVKEVDRKILLSPGIQVKVGKRRWFNVFYRL
jgi:tyrosyl-tRNA synthetase